MQRAKLIPTSPALVTTGAIVWSQGYRWSVRGVTVDSERCYTVHAVAADPLAGYALPPAGYREDMRLGFGQYGLAPVEEGTNNQAPAELTTAEREEADTLTRAHTCFESLADMQDAKGHYTPSLFTSERNTQEDRAGLLRLADLYDQAQASRTDPRRAYRY